MSSCEMNVSVLEHLIVSSVRAHWKKREEKARLRTVRKILQTRRRRKKSVVISNIYLCVCVYACVYVHNTGNAI
jgi:hypothetical protein